MADARVKTDIPDVVAELEVCKSCHGGYTDLAAHLSDCVERARKLLKDHNHKREMDCLAEIQEVLDRYGMQLTTSPAQIVLSSRSS